MFDCVMSSGFRKKPAFGRKISRWDANGTGAGNRCRFASAACPSAIRKQRLSGDKAGPIRSREYSIPSSGHLGACLPSLTALGIGCGDFLTPGIRYPLWGRTVSTEFFVYFSGRCHTGRAFVLRIDTIRQLLFFRQLHTTRALAAYHGIVLCCFVPDLVVIAQ